MRAKEPEPHPSAEIESLEPLFSIAEVAARFRTGREQVHRWVRNHDLVAIRVGRLVRISAEALAEFELKHTTSTRSKR